MKIQSLVISSLLSIGVFTVISLIGNKVALEYTYAAFANMDIGGASDAIKIVELTLFLGVLCACYLSIGFVNRIRTNAFERLLYAALISLPVIILATYPELKNFYLDTKDVKNLVYHSFAAVVGILLGLRFNRLKHI